jgi:transcriptional regulator with GAF, ATPase, and Fis domain
MVARATPTLAWQELLELHTLRRLAAIIYRRWGIGVGFASADGTSVRPPRAQAHSLCPLIQGRTTGDAGCVSTATRLSGLFANQHTRAELDQSAIVYACHAGVSEIAVPIVVDGQYLGCLLAGGFLSTEDAAAEVEVDKRIARFSLPVADLARAKERHPRLAYHEVSWLTELMESAADEIIAFQAAQLEREGNGARDKLATRYSYDAIIGRSRPMQDLYRLLDKVIDSESTVLIQGENGTGKELVAKAIHHNSSRKNRRFVIQNCSAFNDNLLDSELFGHKKGSFTGAIADKQGLFEVADGGTFFLDEIGDMSPSLQVKLLRVLQEGTFIPVGDTSPRQVDVRIIAATNRDLKKMVEHGEFREDLYYRINVINLTLPPLRDRRDDIPVLVEHFLRKHSRGGRVRAKTLSKGCVDRILEYHWPGNIRELENEIERLVVLTGDEKMIGEELLSPRIRERSGHSGGDAAGSTEPNGLPDAISLLERTMIHEVLRRHHGNKTRAASELKISRRNLIRLVQKYKLDTPRK